MSKFIAYVIVGFLGFYLATLLVPGVKVEGSFEESIKVLFFAGIAFGIVNYFLKPIINLITLPLRVLTFGLFGLIVNMLMVWIVDILFPKLIIVGFWPLFWTGLLIWFLSFLTSQKEVLSKIKRF